MQTSNGANYFNILPPGSRDIAMFVGSSSGNSFLGVLPTDGDYAIRVYLMRSAARRNEAASYKLTVGVTGQALAATPAAKDALIPGTSFHASATIACTPPYVASTKECDAFVIRRGFDGTATVEVRWGEGLKRRILFAKGKAVAADSPEVLIACSSKTPVSKEAPRTTPDVATASAARNPDVSRASVRVRPVEVSSSARLRWNAAGSRDSVTANAMISRPKFSTMRRDRPA